ncbi:MAG: hypothetical protein Q8P84_02420 [Deltaproteobacteria bacterium]|nr:hypothetical protein [Deltaproteobacteria bacterium]
MGENRFKNPISFQPAQVFPRLPFHVSGGSMISSSSQSGDVYFISDKSKPASPLFHAEKFVRQKTSSLFDLGKPLLKPDTFIADLDDGETEVFASGVEKSWENMPADAERTCLFTARGILFSEKKGMLPLLVAIIADPKLHPKILKGVEASKNVREFPVNPPDLYHFYNLQKGGDMQYLTDIIARDYRYGVTIAQRSLDDVEGRLKAEELFPDRRTDLLKNYIGQMQFLEVANGTVIIMEMRAYAARIPAGCSTAADTWPIPDFLGGDRGVKQRMEKWLKNLHRAAADAQFMEAMLR